jgi:hypothetical protein
MAERERDRSPVRSKYAFSRATCDKGRALYAELAEAAKKPVQPAYVPLKSAIMDIPLEVSSVPSAVYDGYEAARICATFAHQRIAAFDSERTRQMAALVEERDWLATFAELDQFLGGAEHPVTNAVRMLRAQSYTRLNAINDVLSQRLPEGPLDTLNEALDNAGRTNTQKLRVFNPHAVQPAQPAPAQQPPAQ